MAPLLRAPVSIVASKAVAKFAISAFTLSSMYLLISSTLAALWYPAALARPCIILLRRRTSTSCSLKIEMKSSQKL